jgi:hypothetical protein
LNNHTEIFIGDLKMLDTTGTHDGFNQYKGTNVKPGDLAFVVKSKTDYGKIVKVLRPVTKEDGWVFNHLLGVVWRVSDPLIWHDRSKNAEFKIPFCPDYNLRPIKGNLQDDETETQKELDKPLTVE